jgi:hypothetical protein
MEAVVVDAGLGLALACYVQVHRLLVHWRGTSDGNHKGTDPTDRRGLARIAGTHQSHHARPPIHRFARRRCTITEPISVWFPHGCTS